MGRRRGRARPHRQRGLRHRRAARAEHAPRAHRSAGQGRGPRSACAAHVGPGQQADDEADDEPVDLEYDELEAYGRHVSQLLALAVTGDSGIGIYTFEEWQVAAQHYPQVVRRLQMVAERLSGFDAEAVEKNSQASPS